ncbi:hypothetical protein GCM10022267_22300 [Lentzea roselyniae]|uniref:Uncharacterized protein n=1 Tax=Lentzea roselyniae TaxID=531940 RepID=A0ABP7AM65_9PSEU
MSFVSSPFFCFEGEEPMAKFNIFRARPAGTSPGRHGAGTARTYSRRRKGMVQDPPREAPTEPPS